MLTHCGTTLDKASGRSICFSIHWCIYLKRNTADTYYGHFFGYWPRCPRHIWEAWGDVGVREHCGGLFKAPPSLCDQASHLRLGHVWPALCIQRSQRGSLMEFGVCVMLGSPGWNGVSGGAVVSIASVESEPLWWASEGVVVDELSKWVPLCPLNPSSLSHTHTLANHCHMWVTFELRAAYDPRYERLIHESCGSVCVDMVSQVNRSLSVLWCRESAER